MKSTSDLWVQDIPASLSCKRFFSWYQDSKNKRMASSYLWPWKKSTSLWLAVSYSGSEQPLYLYIIQYGWNYFLNGTIGTKCERQTYRFDNIKS